MFTREFQFRDGSLWARREGQTPAAGQVAGRTVTHRNVENNEACERLCVERTTECKAFWYGDGGKAAGASATRKRCVLSTKLIDHETFDYDNPHYPKRAYPKGADG